MLKTYQTDGLSLKEEVNLPLYRKGKGIHYLIYEYIIQKKLKLYHKLYPYYFSSIDTLSFKEFEYNMFIFPEEDSLKRQRKYNSKDLHQLEIESECLFDTNGCKKTYNLGYITLIVPSDIKENTRAIEYPLCVVKWKDLKMLLLNDKRAVIKWENKKRNMADILENRECLFYFYQTTDLERVE